MRLHMPILPALLLGLGTWLLYVADRILDGLRPGERLRERHYFHARHRTAFVIAASFLFLPFAWYVLTRMRREAFHDDLYIGVFALLYLLVVHRRIAPLRLPKELAVAVLRCFVGSTVRESRNGKAALLTPARAGPACTCAQLSPRLRCSPQQRLYSLLRVG